MAWDDRLFATDGHILLGKVIRKVFNTEPFDGKVVGWRRTKGEIFFRVVYSDNDVEDLVESEILRCSSVSDMCQENKMELENAVESWRIGRNKSICGNMEERKISSVEYACTMLMIMLCWFAPANRRLLWFTMTLL